MKKSILIILVLCMLTQFASSQVCSPSAAISMPFTKDGAGQFCFEAACIGAPVNSWNMTQLTINGVDFTNKWADASAMPAPIDGKYYIVYNGAYAWSHFEATGGTCAAVTPTPEETPTPTPTGTPIIIPDSMTDVTVTDAITLAPVEGATVTTYGTLYPSMTSVTNIGTTGSTGRYYTFLAGWSVNRVEISKADYATLVINGLAIGSYQLVPVTTTPEPTGDLGKVWLDPAISNVAQSQDAVLEIHANTGTKALGAYSFTVNYPADMLTYKSVTEIATGINLLVNSNTPGKLVMAGFNATGVPGSTDLSLIKITFGTPEVGAARVELTVENLNDVDTLVIGTPRGSSAQIGIEGPVTLPPTPEPTPIVIAPVIDSIDPTSGPIGTTVTVNGNGFAQTGNVVIFQDADSGGIWETRITTDSPDGKTIKFTVPAFINPGCYYQNPACASPSMATQVGPYIVFVSVSDVRSNGALFTVMADPQTPVPVTPDPATPTMTPTTTPTGTPTGTPTPIVTPVSTPTSTPTSTPVGDVQPPTSAYATVNSCVSPIIVTVGWSASPSANIASYKIYRSCISGGPYSLIGTLNIYSIASSYTFQDPAPSANCFYFVVTAVNTSGVESAYSAQGPIAVSSCPQPTPTTTPESECIPCIVPTLAPDLDPNATPIASPIMSAPPTIPPIAGTVILTTVNKTLKMCSNFDINVYVNTGTKILGAYGFTINYPVEMIGINTCTGLNGVTAGTDGFVNAVNASTPGILKLAGFDASGKGPGTNLLVCTISCKVLAYQGTKYDASAGYYGYPIVTLGIDNLVDLETNTIGEPQSVQLDYFTIYSGSNPPALGV